MGSTSGCAYFTSKPLWYAHYDNNPSFSDYSKYAFGGWSTPSIKQYLGDTTLCSVGVDLNFYWTINYIKRLKSYDLIIFNNDKYYKIKGNC